MPRPRDTPSPPRWSLPPEFVVHWHLTELQKKLSTCATQLPATVQMTLTTAAGYNHKGMTDRKNEERHNDEVGLSH